MQNLKSWFALWWRAVRAYAYPASIVPSLLGLAIAWSDTHKINIPFAILTFIGAIAAHTGANLLNDYVDYLKGVDREGTLGGSGVLVEKLLKPKDILTGSYIFFAIALLCGIPICLFVGKPMVMLILFGFVCGAGYVASPLGLKYKAMGDLTVFLAFGVGITVGSYMAQTGHFSYHIAFASMPIGILVAAILHVNNMRDTEDDSALKVKTLAGLAGPKYARLMFICMIVAAYLLIILLAFLEILPKGAIVTLLTMPVAYKLVMMVARSKEDHGGVYIKAVIQTAQLNLIFGVAMILGIILTPVFESFGNYLFVSIF